MQKTLLLLTILICLVFSTYAQDSTSPKVSVGLSQGAAIGPVSGAYPTAGGIDLKVELPVAGNSVNLILTTGYTFYVSRGGFSTGFYADSYGSGSYTYGSLASFVPIMAGIKAYVFNKFFIEGDVGASFNINANYAYFTGKQTALIYSPSAGYSIPLGMGKNSVDIGLGYQDRIEPGGGYSQIFVKGAFNFSL
ncbi:MAG TPA: hypothetical protein VGI43_18085 [Mucilaginibacter sp.]|jgi:hypothetical protein